MIHLGDIMSTVGYSNNKRFFSHGTQDIPHGTHDIPTVLNTPTVMSTPHGTAHTLYGVGSVQGVRSTVNEL